MTMIGEGIGRVKQKKRIIGRSRVMLVLASVSNNIAIYSNDIRSVLV